MPEVQIENSFTLDSLVSRYTAIAYQVDRAISAAYPEMHCLCTEGSAFDIEEFADAGNCRLRVLDNPHAHIESAWHGREYGIAVSIENAWLDVEWQGERFTVVLMSWPSIHWGDIEQKWVIGDDRQTVERFFQTVCEWCSEVRGEVLVFAEGCWSKSKELFHAIRSSTLDNLILQGDLKQKVAQDFEQFFASRSTYERYGIPWKRGVLFLGPPGNGKTHAVKALINHLGYPCLYVKSFRAQHTSAYRCIQQVFERARNTVPCVLVLEDLDSLLDDENRSFFLNELDGFAANTGIVTLATTNHPERLDPAILDRPSRFDRKYHFELPAEPERAAYLQLWNQSLESEVRLTEVGIETAARATEGFSFAYLKELVLSSLMTWIQSPIPGDMDAVAHRQVVPLRQQMESASDEPLPALVGDGDRRYNEDED